MQKQLLITFDYELFLGNRSGSVEECMIEPTNRITAIMDGFGVKAVFFVDTTCLLRIKDQAVTDKACQADFEKISSQLRRLVAGGHDVFPHIHPHWLDATYNRETNQWKLNDVTRYRFHKLNQEEKARVFDGSVKILGEILESGSIGYDINGFRAGGWCIQPFTDFQPFFEKNKIQNEFSVLGGFYQFTDAQYFDFSNAPGKNIYRFLDDVCREDTRGPFIQYNISSIQIPGYINLMNKLWLKLSYKLFNDHTFHKGEGQPSKIFHNEHPVNPDGKDLGDPAWERISIELMTAVKMNLYLEYFDRHPYMHFISHPKMMTRHNMKMFERFLRRVTKKYAVVSDFRLMVPQ